MTTPSLTPDPGPGNGLCARESAPEPESMSLDVEARPDASETRTALRESPCPGGETAPNTCRCGCEGCKHHCAAHRDDGPGTAQEESPFGEALRRAGVTREAFDRTFDALSGGWSPERHAGHGSPCEDSPEGSCAAPAAPVLRDQLAAALREAACPGDCGNPEDECCKTRLQPVVWRHGTLDGIDGSPELIADAVLPVVHAELARVQALHADTERRLRADLAAEVRKREAAEATAETFRHKAVRRGLRLARVTGVLDAVREMAAEKVTARNEWGDGYRDAIRDLNEILDGLAPKETPHD